jgi:hypothetical protein
MATHTGSEGTIKIGSDTLGEIRSYTLESTGEVIEDTSMGDSARSYKAGLTTFTGSLEVFFDETDTAQGNLDAGSSVTLEVYPEGATTGDTYYTGTAIVTGRTVTASFDGMVEMSISVQGSGGLTETTV